MHLLNNSINGDIYVGAIAGFNAGTIQNCSCQGTVIGSDIDVGGITGYNAGTVENCSNNSTASDNTVSGDYYVGGIAGRNDGDVRRCSNSSAVEEKNPNAGGVGGIAGLNMNSGIIQNCSNSGTVSSGDGRGDNYVGGIVGDNRGAVANCYNRGNVISTQYPGGVMGYSNQPSINNYFLKTSGINKSLPGIATIRGNYKTPSNVGAEPKTAADMQSNEFAYILNSANGTAENSGSWSRNAGQNEGYPIFADNENKAIYRVAFNNEGTTESKYSDYTGKVSLLATPASGDTDFFGWYTGINGTGTVFADTNIVSGDLTVYADWDNAEVPVITKDLTSATTTVGTAVTLDATATVSDGGTLSQRDLWGSSVDSYSI